MTIAAVVERLGWQAEVSNIAVKNQQIPGKVIKVQVGIFFGGMEVSMFFGLK